MPSRRDLPPTPVELAAWLAVASPRTARGRSRWTPGEQPWRGTFTYGGRRPVMCHPPAGVEVDFWHAAPDRWRLDVPDGPLCRSDGTTAVVWSDQGLQVSGALLVFSGPPQLLHPSADLRMREVPDGEVSPDELLGRRCWR